ncbi:MarR family winged helix-turn-helix transcriptional regulator [Mycobacterium sp.]|uniref:MarR family winged helix-turn-helix transcriptional regulator n=1 Tax=Mycobacterium sp. TaxID=1785 RepID=UPI003C77C58F
MEFTDKLLWPLKQAFHLSLKTINEAISEHGVAASQVGLMRQLADEPGLSGAELARRLLITPQAAQLALAELARRGLIERKQDPQHGRILLAYLTDEGRAVTSAALVDALAAHETVFGVLTSDERQLLHDLLNRVVEQGGGHDRFTDHDDL